MNRLNLSPDVQSILKQYLQNLGDLAYICYAHYENSIEGKNGKKLPRAISTINTRKKYNLYDEIVYSNEIHPLFSFAINLAIPYSSIVHGEITHIVELPFFQKKGYAKISS